MQLNFCVFEELCFPLVLDSGLRIPESGFQFAALRIPDSGFRIPGFRVAPLVAEWLNLPPC